MILLANLNTLFIGQSLHHLVETDSTNSYAIQLLAKSAPADGTIIVTDFQRAGRGQFDRTWQSNAGENLLFSLILYPRFVAPSRQFILTQAISIGVAEALQQVCSLPISVKWPNDLYIGKKKVAGILIQTALGQQKMQYAVVGIGLNVNQVAFPKALPNPTSLSLATKKSLDRAEVLTTILEYIERWYLNLRSGQISLIEQRSQQLLFQFGEWALYRIPGGEPFSGKIVGFTPQGKLKVETQRGIQIFNFKEIQFLI